MKLLKFYAEWCGPCKMLSMSMASIEGSEGFPKVEEIDIDRNEEMVDRYKIRSVPTMVFVDDEGNEITRILGYKTNPQIKAALGLEIGQ